MTQQLPTEVITVELFSLVHCVQLGAQQACQFSYWGSPLKTHFFLIIQNLESSYLKCFCIIFGKITKCFPGINKSTGYLILKNNNLYPGKYWFTSADNMKNNWITIRATKICSYLGSAASLRIFCYTLIKHVCDLCFWTTF